jgi:hypothetical protein
MGCSDSPCGFLTPNCVDRLKLSSSEKSELFQYGVTLADEGVNAVRFLKEGPDSVAALEEIFFYFSPAPGTENLEPQFDGLNLNFDSIVSARSELAFIDSNGVKLDKSNNSNCIQNLNGSSTNTILAFEGPTVPDNYNYLLQSWVKCIPASAKKIVHLYTNDTDATSAVVEIELTQLRQWRNKIIPILCTNDLCE